MTLRISFEVPPQRNGRLRPRQTLRYGLTELLEFVADWWHLRQAGRSPRIHVELGR